MSGSQPSLTRDVLELALEVGLWTAIFLDECAIQDAVWYQRQLPAFLPPLALTLFRGMRLAVLALAANAMIATTLWYLLIGRRLFRQPISGCSLPFTR